MKTLEYYFEIEHKNVFAYNGETEFFVRFVKDEKKWENCNFSFMAFEHDVLYKELTEDEVKAITDGNLPEKEFNAYENMLENNVKGCNSDIKRQKNTQ